MNREGIAKIPRDLIKRQCDDLGDSVLHNLTPQSLSILIVILAHRNKDSGFAQVGARRIAKLAGVGINSISPAVNDLKELCLIRVEKRRKSRNWQEVNRYHSPYLSTGFFTIGQSVIFGGHWARLSDSARRLYLLMRERCAENAFSYDPEALAYVMGDDYDHTNFYGESDELLCTTQANLICQHLKWYRKKFKRAEQTLIDAGLLRRVDIGHDDDSCYDENGQLIQDAWAVTYRGLDYLEKFLKRIGQTGKEAGQKIVEIGTIAM